MIQLGLKAQDKITGFEGIIIGRCQYLTGCDQYGLVPPAKDGKIEGAQWFDEGRVTIVGAGVSAADVAAPDNGGPNRDAPNR